MMKTFLKISLLLSVAAYNFTGCTKITGDGPVVTENRTTTNFSGIQLSIPGDVIFKQDNNYKIEIEAQQNILDVIQTTVTGNELSIKYKDDVIVRRHDRIRISISAPQISGFTVNGSGNLRTSGNIQAENFHMNISGSGNIFIEQLAVTKLDGVISGSGDVYVSDGVARQENLKITGSGSIDISRLPAKTAVTTISGSGGMKVNLGERLDASITGSGTVYYRGNPIVNTHITGSGKVRPM